MMAKKKAARAAKGKVLDVEKLKTRSSQPTNGPASQIDEFLAQQS